MKIREIDWTKIPTDSAYEHKMALEDYSEEAIRATGSDFLAIEVGTHFGATSALLYEYFFWVIAVDPWYTKTERGEYDTSKLDVDRLAGFYSTKTNLGLSGVIPILSTSDSLVPFGSEASLVFIDGDHSSKAVTNDIRNVDKHLLLNGFLVFHDYHRTWEGVVFAIDNSLVLKEKYKVFDKREDGLICFKKAKP